MLADILKSVKQKAEGWMLFSLPRKIGPGALAENCAYLNMNAYLIRIEFSKQGMSLY